MTNYEVQLRPQASKDLKHFPVEVQRRLLLSIQKLEEGLQGDVKRLVHHQPQYRLRVGDYRVLFEVEGDKVVIYRVRLRKDAYR